MASKSTDDYDIDEAISKYSSEICNEKDKLAVIIHLIMLKFGFKHSEQELKQSKGSQFNKIYYNQIRTDFKLQKINNYALKFNLVILLLQSGNIIDICAKYSAFNSGFLKLNLKEFFHEPNLYIVKKLDLKSVLKQFKIDFKDNILNPIKFYLKETELPNESNFINGLCDLPIELIHKLVLNYLDIGSLVKLSKLNRYFNNLINSNLSSNSSIWFRLIRRDFDSNFSLSNVNYRTHYVKLYKNRKLFNKKYN